MRKTIFIILFISFFIIKGYAQGEKAVVYDSNGKRDPFLPLVSPEGALINFEPLNQVSEVNLEGIIYDEGGKSFAIINSKVVKTGDRIGSIEVVDIQKNRVVLLKGSEMFEIKIKEGE